MVCADIIFDLEIKIKHLEKIMADNLMLSHVADEWNMKMVTSDRQCSLFTWLKPPMGFWVLSCDGSMTANRSSYGGLIQSCDGEPLIGYAGTSEQQHVSWLEMFALYCGLVVARNCGIPKLRVNLDSKLVVDITNNRNKCPWRVLSLQAKNY